MSPGIASNTIVNCIAIGAEKKHFFFCSFENILLENILLYVVHSKKLFSFFTTLQASEDSFIQMSSVQIVVLPNQVFHKRVTSDNYTINCIKNKQKKYHHVSSGRVSIKHNAEDMCVGVRRRIKTLGLARWVGWALQKTEGHLSSHKISPLRALSG